MGVESALVVPQNLHLSLSNPDKVLYPELGVTKTTLALYYSAVAEHLMPLLGGRPLALVRCPNGVGGTCFFQKHAEDLPDAVRRVAVRGPNGLKAEHPYINSPQGLMAMVQLGVLELHAWGCHAEFVDRPDLLVFDLDPDEALPFRQTVVAARELKSLLDDLELQSFVKTTGGKGLHVVVPIERTLDWATFKTFAHDVVNALAHAHPDRYVTQALKKLRIGKIFLDYLRNGRGATAIGAYSTRARAGATVSVPLAWPELTAALDPLAFTVLTVPPRLKAMGNDSPWRDFAHTKQRVTRAMQKKVAL